MHAISGAVSTATISVPLSLRRRARITLPPKLRNSHPGERIDDLIHIVVVVVVVIHLVLSSSSSTQTMLATCTGKPRPI